MELASSSLADLQAKIRMDTQNTNAKYRNIPERDINTVKATLQSGHNTKPNPSKL